MFELRKRFVVSKAAFLCFDIDETVKRYLKDVNTWAGLTPPKSRNKFVKTTGDYENLWMKKIGWVKKAYRTTFNCPKLSQDRKPSQ